MLLMHLKGTTIKNHNERNRLIVWLFFWGNRIGVGIGIYMGMPEDLIYAEQEKLLELSSDVGLIACFLLDFFRSTLNSTVVTFWRLRFSLLHHLRWNWIIRRRSWWTDWLQLLQLRGSGRDANPTSQLYYSFISHRIKPNVRNSASRNSFIVLPCGANVGLKRAKLHNYRLDRL